MAAGLGSADCGAAGGGGPDAFDRRGRGEIGRGGGAGRRRVADLPALRRGRRGAQGHGARPPALSLQIMRPNLQRGDQDAAARAAQEGALAVVRGIPGGGRNGGGLPQRCGIAHSTAFRWRHRFLDASRQDPETLRGIVEADETYLLQSRKGERTKVRPARRRMPCWPPRRVATRPARSLGLSRIALNQSAGQRIRDPCHIQTVGNRQSRFKGFLFHFRGVTTNYLGNRLQRCQLACLDENASPSTCLGAAVNSACIRIAK